MTIGQRLHGGGRVDLPVRRISRQHRHPGRQKPDQGVRHPLPKPELHVPHIGQPPMSFEFRRSIPALTSALAGTIPRRMRERAPIGLLALALVTSGALLLSYASNLTFVGDGWELLAGRPDWAAGTFFRPFNEHPIMLVALVYKVLL